MKQEQSRPSKRELTEGCCSYISLVRKTDHLLAVLILAFALACISLPQLVLAGLMPANKLNPAPVAPTYVVPAEQPKPAPTIRGAEEIPEQNKFYDPENPGFERLQKANESLVGFPLDKKGYVDWMGAIRSGFIKPRADLRGNEQMQVLELDVLLKDTKEMPYVKFPHNSHTLWLACSNCHPKPFIPKAGANDISMASIFRGDYCGMCHDRVAFVTFFSCERCHSVPHGETKAWW